MTAEEQKLVELLEERLGYAFPDRKLALQALTHKSWVNEHRVEAHGDNERLEFLGDAVVDLAVSQRLMERLPEAREGLLSRLRAWLVNTEALAQVAEGLGLGELLRLGRGEELTGGRAKPSLLANTLEAVVGAIYLADGQSAVLHFVDRFVMSDLAEATSPNGGRDHKTRLQELAQALLGVTPRYRVVAEQGPDHDKTFEVELLLGEDVHGHGEGRSKKEAEQAAAAEGIASLQALPPRTGEAQ